MSIVTTSCDRWSSWSVQIKVIKPLELRPARSAAAGREPGRLISHSGGPSPSNMDQEASVRPVKSSLKSWGTCGTSCILVGQGSPDALSNFVIRMFAVQRVVKLNSDRAKLIETHRGGITIHIRRYVPGACL